MLSAARPSLAAYLIDLQARGQITFTRTEAIAALGVTEGAFLKAAGRLQQRRMLSNPRHGFYVVVPSQFHSWGAPPPSWYIDALMQGRPYYVGLLKAAEIHGAAHQAVMDFQVVTDRQLRKVQAGRSWLTFHFRKGIEALRDGIDEHKTATGTMKVSSPELTAFDLLRYSHVIGGLDVVATVISELGATLRGTKLSALAAYFDRTHLQRLGYLLEWLGHGEPAEELHGHFPADAGSLQWVTLEPSPRNRGQSLGKPLERNERWRVAVRRHPDIG